VQRDGRGHATNAVLILHGTGGAGTQFIGSKRGDELFAGELFGPGQPLDVLHYFIVIPDSIGHGRSSRPSDGLHAHFPKYGYRDAVETQFRLLTEGLGVDHCACSSELRWAECRPGCGQSATLTSAMR